LRRDGEGKGEGVSTMIAVRHPSSAAEVFANAAAVRKRLFSPPARPVKRAEPVEAVVTRVYMTAPTERVWREQYDCHVIAYYSWKGNTPVGFLKMRCRELGVDYADVTGSRRTRQIVSVRGQLIAELKTLYPEMTLPSMGRLFGGRDHTTILYFLRKHGAVAPDGSTRCRLTAHWNPKVKELFDQGMKLKDIARAIGRSQTTVSFIIKQNGWKRTAPCIEDHTDKIREMFLSGMPPKEIGPVIGYSRSHVANYVRLMGWKR
jgi:hypothetical protein